LVLRDFGVGAIITGTTGITLDSEREILVARYAIVVMIFYTELTFGWKDKRTE